MLQELIFKNNLVIKATHHPRFVLQLQTQQGQTLKVELEEKFAIC